MERMDTEEMERPFGLRVVHTDRALAPTGEPHVVLSGVGGAEEAKAAFDDYAKDKSGILYWRVHPELRSAKETTSLVPSFFMRLLISNKDPRL